MSSDFRVNGADDFLKLSKLLKQAGRSDLRKALNKGLRDGVKPLIPKVRAAAARELPRRGGLAAKVAKDPIRVAVKTGNRPGVSLVMKNQPGYLDGVIRHPTPNGAWVKQRVDGDWFDGTVEDNLRDVLPALEKTVKDMWKNVERGLS